LFELLKLIIWLLFHLTLIFLKPILIILAIAIIIIFIKDIYYKKSVYYQITRQSYWSIKKDLGKYGEYLIYKQLMKFEKNGAKFLFNLYVPKENSKTTEIDVLMITHKGLFVFESKNFSGWIFGRESQRSWCQTLPKGRGISQKEIFYNPIMQNRLHIKCLKTLLQHKIPVHSVIVFSNRCTLKDVQISSNDIKVINRYDLAFTVSEIYEQTEIDLLSDNDINEIYNKLYSYTQVDDITKRLHILNLANTPSESFENKCEEISKNVSEKELLEKPSVVSDQLLDKEIECDKSVSCDPLQRNELN